MLVPALVAMSGQLCVLVLASTCSTPWSSVVESSENAVEQLKELGQIPWSTAPVSTLRSILHYGRNPLATAIPSTRMDVCVCVCPDHPQLPLRIPAATDHPPCLDG